METAINYFKEFWQSEMVQTALQKMLAFILSFVDMDVVHDEVFIIIFVILVFIGLFFLLAVFTKGLVRVISIFFAFFMMIAAMTIYGAVGTGLLQVKFDEAKLEERAERERKKLEENKPPAVPPAVPQVPLESQLLPQQHLKGSNEPMSDANNFGLPSNDMIHWEIYDPWEKPKSLNEEKQIAGENKASKPLPPKQEEKVAESPEKRNQRIQVGRQLAAIEQELKDNVTFIDDHLRDIDNKVKAGEIDDFTALAQKARWGSEKQHMLLDALDAKASILAQADLLNDADKANDFRILNERRLEANARLAEYRNVLQQIENNEAVLKTLW